MLWHNEDVAVICIKCWSRRKQGRAVVNTIYGGQSLLGTTADTDNNKERTTGACPVLDNSAI